MRRKAFLPRRESNIWKQIKKLTKGWDKISWEQKTSKECYRNKTNNIA